MKASVREWQPIETAPKGDPSDRDVESILLSRWPYLCIGYWCWDRNEWLCDGIVDDLSFADEYAGNSPTHWMPLPEPPR